MEKRNIMRTVTVGLVTTVTTVLATLLITGLFSGGEQGGQQVSANTTKHARVVLNGQVVKEGKVKKYGGNSAQNAHYMYVEFEDGTEAVSSPNNIVIWSE